MNDEREIVARPLLTRGFVQDNVTAGGDASDAFGRAKVSGELFQTGVIATVLVVVMIAVYVAFRFEWQFGVAGMLATGHDVLVAVGMYSLLQFDFNLTSVAALIT